jgi:hypothetical protein
MRQAVEDLRLPLKVAGIKQRKVRTETTGAMPVSAALLGGE